MKESDFQRKVIDEINYRLPGCMILKNDPTYIQGIPDLMILFGDRWAALECKQNAHSKKRPNQNFYVNTMNQMSFAAFIYDSNAMEVLDELERFMLS